MARARAKKRSIVVDGKTYLWRASEEYEQSHFDGLQVAIMAEHGPLYLKYGLRQSPDSCSLWAGSDFVRCPQFERGTESVSPGMVGRILEWYLGERPVIR